MSLLLYVLVGIVVGLIGVNAKAASIGRLDTITSVATAPWGGFVVSPSTRLFAPSNRVREHTIRCLDDPFRARYHVSLRDSCGEEVSSEIQGFSRDGVVVLESWEISTIIQQNVRSVTMSTAGVDYRTNTVLWWRYDVRVISVLEHEDAILVAEHGNRQTRYALLNPRTGTRLRSLKLPTDISGMPHVIDNGRKVMWLNPEKITVYDIPSDTYKQYRDVIPKEVRARMIATTLGYGEHLGEPYIIVLHRSKGQQILRKYYLGDSAPCDVVDYPVPERNKGMVSLLNGTDTLLQYEMLDGRLQLKVFSLQSPTLQQLWNHRHSVELASIDDVRLAGDHALLFGKVLLVRFFYGAFLIDLLTGKESYIGGFYGFNKGEVCADAETVVLSSYTQKKSVIFNVRTKSVSLRDYDHGAVAPGTNLLAFLRKHDGTKYCMVEDVVAGTVIKRVPIPDALQDSTLTVLSFSSSANKVFLNTGPYTSYVLDLNDSSRSFTDVFPCQYMPLASFTDDDRFIYVFGCTAMSVWDTWAQRPVSTVEKTDYLNAYARPILPGSRIGLLQKDDEVRYVSIPELDIVDRLPLPYGWHVRQFMDADHVIVAHGETLHITDKRLHICASIRYVREFEAAIPSFYHCNPEAKRILVANLEGNLLLLTYTPPTAPQE